MALQFDIGHPTNREDVPDFVFENFRESDLDFKVDEAVKVIETLF